MMTSHVEKVLPETGWAAITVCSTIKHTNESRRLQNDAVRI